MSSERALPMASDFLLDLLTCFSSVIAMMASLFLSKSDGITSVHTVFQSHDSALLPFVTVILHHGIASVPVVVLLCPLSACFCRLLSHRVKTRLRGGVK